MQEEAKLVEKLITFALTLSLIPLSFGFAIFLILLGVAEILKALP